MATKEWRDANREKLRSYRKKHYHAHKERYRVGANARSEKRREWARSLKDDKSCMYCRESFWACLEFHHREKDGKEFNLSSAMYVRKLGKDKILAEIEKCDVVCSNCHRKLHHGGLGLMETTRLQPDI